MKRDIMFVLFIPMILSSCSDKNSSPISVSTTQNKEDNKNGPSPLHSVGFEEASFSAFKEKYDEFRKTDFCPLICFDFDNRPEYKCTYSLQKSWSDFIIDRPVVSYKYKFNYSYETTQDFSYSDHIGIGFKLEKPTPEIEDFDKEKVTFEYDRENWKLDFIYSGVHLFKMSIGFGKIVEEDTKTNFIESLKDAVVYLK